MELNKIYNEDCVKFINETLEDNSIDLVMSSPPYNTSRPGDRYDKTTFNDRKSQEEYIDWINSIFKGLETKIKPNGVICWNVSYGGDGQDVDNQATVWLSIASIIQNTTWTVAEHIVWKKSCCTPNSVSPNRLDRICEDIFIFCRKSELKTFHANKKEVSTREKTGQKNYRPIRNFIEAPNNDGATPEINGATYSSDLCNKIFEIYAPKNGTVYDPFMGTGTTAIACDDCELNYVGTEINPAEIDYANNRIDKYKRDGRVKTNSKEKASTYKAIGLF